MVRSSIQSGTCGMNCPVPYSASEERVGFCNLSVVLFFGSRHSRDPVLGLFLILRTPKLLCCAEHRTLFLGICVISKKQASLLNARMVGVKWHPKPGEGRVVTVGLDMNRS